MKYMVTWNIPKDTWIPVLKMFTALSPAERADAGPGVKIVGRWHDVCARKGVAIVEADDITAVQRYNLRWNPYMDLVIAPVVDDEESVPVYESLVGEKRS
jgi:hypothetical protein